MRAAKLMKVAKPQLHPESLNFPDRLKDKFVMTGTEKLFPVGEMEIATHLHITFFVSHNLTSYFISFCSPISCDCELRAYESTTDLLAAAVWTVVSVCLSLSRLHFAWSAKLDAVRTTQKKLLCLPVRLWLACLARLAFFVFARRWVDTHSCAIHFCLGFFSASLGKSTGLALGKPKQQLDVARVGTGYTVYVAPSVEIFSL